MPKSTLKQLEKENPRVKYLQGLRFRNALAELEKERDLGYKKIAALQLQINKESKYIELIQKEIIKLKG